MKRIGLLAHSIVVAQCIIALVISLSHASVTVSIGDGLGAPGSANNLVAVSLDNTDGDSNPDNNKVKAVQMKICDRDNYLGCTGCDVTPERTTDFSCSCSEQADGCCKIFLFSADPDALIDEGTGPIFTVQHGVVADAPRGACVELAPEEVQVADMMNDPLEVLLSESGVFCLLCTSDADCEDGLYCNGGDGCEDDVCVHTGDPCTAGTVCNEENNSCDLITTTTTTTTTAIPILTIGDGSSYPGSTVQVEVSLDNQNDKVRGVQLDICDADNYLACAACSVSSRAADFQCLINELESGCCRVELFSLGTNLVNEGTGPLFTLAFDASEDAPSEGCRDLTAEDIRIADEDGDPFPPAGVVAVPGEVCFFEVHPVTITPNPIWKSHWIPLPYLMVIHGNDTHFKAWDTTVRFSHPSSVIRCFPLVWDEYYIWIMVWAMPCWWSGAENQSVKVTVTTEEEVVEGDVDIQLLPFPLETVL